MPEPADTSADAVRDLRRRPDVPGGSAGGRGRDRPLFRRVLVANRGEIAVRVIRACRDLGMEAVAVYSVPDRYAPHARLADAAYPLRGAAPHESYLNIDALIDIARQAGAEALHPGYGFLAENPLLADACGAAGIAFVGPPAVVLRLCGDKAVARERIVAAGVPVLPGTSPIADVEAPAAARRVGFPLLIKAVGGGGGKGIHLVRTPEDLPGALRLARGEALTAFGDGRVYLERWVERARHVEIQILADHRAGVIHLGERECSVQRRHQKLIEESPSPALTPALRGRMGEAAVAVARALDYRNAGTVEFLVEGDSFYFLEVNARIQVEHPVTELVAGLDLVQWQFRLAGGEPLPFGQEAVRLSGHALQCRISAEDPHAQFLPSVGRIAAVVEPGGPGIRVDSGVQAGTEVSRHYDPLLCKVIAWGETREAAIARMRRALGETVIAGVQTTIPFHRWAVEEPSFAQGTYDTRLIEDRWERRPAPASPPEAVLLVAAAHAYLRDRTVRIPEYRRAAPRSPWREQDQ
ncbi:MAG: ATP-grasp domain-containing protein [Armatimonadetes bacterium]|nr:ATP-grasp domain-containing protein [Armatimonadota bacterium]